MKALIALNESPLGSHPDIYEAFDSLAARGHISSYDIYPFLLERERGSTDDEISSAILRLAHDGSHDLVILMHTGRLVISDAVLEALRRLPQRPSLVYWERDSYHPYFKPIPRAMVAAMRHCDLTFLPCGGPVLGVLARAGVSEVRFAPSTASPTRFPLVWSPSVEPEHDIIMIGNQVSSRIPLKTMPGARRRRRLVKVFERHFGDGFAVYGSGWKGSSARGPRAFDDQKSLYRDSRVAVGVNNSNYPYVFSNRLPIALACGIPLIYSRNPGLEMVLGDCLSDRLFDSVPQAISMAERLLSNPDDLLVAESKANREFFERNLTTELAAEHVLTATAEASLHQPQDPASALGPSVRPAWQSIPPLVTGGRVRG